MERPRHARPLLAAALAAALLATGCMGARATPPAAGVRLDGFPTGVFSKSFDDPELGRVRLSWIFDPSGAWAEVPEAMAGQAFPTGPARGRYVVDGDLVTLEVDYPTFWGWTRHHWRLEGDRLITTYDDSEDPGEAGFFDMLDAQPWVRVP
jgi:hypothetical protein